METEILKKLSVFDSACILVGIIIGAGIYETAPTVAASAGSTLATLAIWMLGGAFAFFGAVCYSQLATALPAQGGDVIYLSKAYGNPAGFLFGWSQMMIIRPGDIALMAFIFARYATALYPFSHSLTIYAVSIVVIFTALNILGVHQGKWVQNILTLIKALGLIVIITAALCTPQKTLDLSLTTPSLSGIELALILVMFTYGGWNEIAYVAAEVKNPAQNITRALFVSVASVCLLYLLINIAFLITLGHSQMSASRSVAVDTLNQITSLPAGSIISALICISCLGAVNGLVFTGARISYATAQQHRFLKSLGHWNPNRQTPIIALLLQGLLSSIIIITAGSFINTILYTAPLAWMFFLATGISVFILRRKQGNFNTPPNKLRYPVSPIIFCATCVFMLYSCITYAIENCPGGFIVMLVLLLTGAAIYPFSKTKMHS